jgi:tetratricopeptide (TPR) repeat protein
VEAPLSNAQLVARFESLGGSGHGSEFGRFQWSHGGKELGLLGWADLSADLLTQALEQRFHGVGEPGNTVIFRPDGSEEWWTRDTSYWMAMRSRIKIGSGHADQEAPAILDRLKRLRSELISDLADGQKIFVFRDMVNNLSETALKRLHAAVQSYGAGTLFYLRYADQAHPPGLMEVAGPNLLVGYVAHFANSPDNRGLGSIDEVLLDLCRKALALADRAAALPTAAEAPAPNPAPPGAIETATGSPAEGRVSRPPQSLDARLAIAESLRKTGKINAALSEVCAAAVIAPNDARTYAALGELMQAVGDLPGAEAAYRRAIRLAPDEAQYHHQVSVVCLATGRHTDAIAAAEAAISRDPQNPLRLGHLADILGNAGDYDRARTTVLAAIDVQPDHAPLHMLYSSLFAREGRLEEALETAQGTVDQMPNHAGALAQLAEIEQMCGHMAEAELHLRAALALAPDDEKLRARMARLTA